MIHENQRKAYEAGAEAMKTDALLAIDALRREADARLLASQPKYGPDGDPLIRTELAGLTWAFVFVKRCPLPAFTEDIV